LPTLEEKKGGGNRLLLPPTHWKRTGPPFEKVPKKLQDQGRKRGGNDPNTFINRKKVPTGKKKVSPSPTPTTSVGRGEKEGPFLLRELAKYNRLPLFPGKGGVGGGGGFSYPG